MYIKHYNNFKVKVDQMPSWCKKHNLVIPSKEGIMAIGNQGHIKTEGKAHTGHGLFHQEADLSKLT